ncbi:MAB_1171c family putative transporter [Streptomyces sp. NPDC050856]|uniref:MAB_1171c family putative transporter n=1 Tax=Streptomyces sp. NPDC050856 TaxID=3154939 RepID=UPI0033EA2B01
MLSIVLGIVLHAALAWKLRQLARAPSDAMLRAVSLCLLCAALSFPLGVPGGARFVDSLAGAGTAKLLQNVTLLCAVYFLSCFFIHSASDPRAARARARRAVLPLAATALVITVAMVMTPAAERGHTYATADMRVTGVAVFYLTAGLYLTYALAVALLWTVRYARVSNRPLVIGLWMVAAALAAMVVAASVREALTLARLLGGDVPRPLIVGAKLLLDLAIPVFVAGVVFPAAVTRWASARLWWHHRRMYRRLAPLWTALHSAFPEDSLHRAPPVSWLDAVSLRAVHRRYYRRVIECRDGLVRISPHLARLEEWDVHSKGTLPPEVAARHLRAALRAYAAGEPAPSRAVPVALPSGDGLEGDVRQLALIADAL